MQEYFGNSAHVFKQSRGKRYLLNPAIERNLPQATNLSNKLLDLGCGNGYFYEMASSKGYQYHGLDISEDMIERSKTEYPKGNYLVASATDFSKKYQEKFDVILPIMLYPAFNSKTDIQKSLIECKSVLKEGGIVLVGLSHPSYDQYMQKGVLGKNEIETDFQGYFKSGQKMLIPHNFSGEVMTFEDYHWTTQDYVDCITQAGLSIVKFDECPPSLEFQKEDPEFFNKRSEFPTYLLLVCKHYRSY